MALAARASGGCEAISAGSATTSDGRTSSASSAPAGMRWKRRHRRARERRGDRRAGKPVGAGDRLRGVDHPAAAEGHERPALRRPAQRRGGLWHAPGRHVEDHAGALARARRRAALAARRW